MRALAFPGVLLGAVLIFAPLALVSAQDKPDAAAIYKQRCAMCHGAKGDSKLPGLSFTDGQWKHGSSMKEVTEIIRKGVDGTAMLPFEGKLKDPEITAMAEFVRAFDPKLKGTN
jgi:mono/diheme cytochrome c family protein